MIKLFLDTEFTGLHQNTTLISLGCVTLKGDTFYAEFNDYAQDQCDSWINDNVISKLHLPKDKPFYFSGDSTPTSKGTSLHFKVYGNTLDIRNSFMDWVTNLHPSTLLPDNSFEIWSDCLAYDMVLFNQLWGHSFKVPPSINRIYQDICTMFRLAGIDPDCNRESFAGTEDLDSKKHNALWDATVISLCHEKLKSFFLPYNLECSNG